MANRDIETCINYCEPGWAFISSNERKWINKVRALNKSRPDECVIIKEPDDNDGVIYGKFMQKWLRIAPPKQVVMSDEKRQKLALRLQEYRSSQKRGEEDAE